MILQNGIVQTTFIPSASVHNPTDRMEYREAEGSKEERRKKAKRRRNHRKTESNDTGQDVTVMPSIFGIGNDKKALPKSPRRDDLSRLILPKLDSIHMTDTRNERVSEKYEGRCYISYGLPKINTSATLTTGSVTCIAGSGLREHSFHAKNSPIDDRTGNSND